MRQVLRDLCHPAHEDWREMVLWRARQIYRQALVGQAGGQAR